MYSDVLYDFKYEFTCKCCGEKVLSTRESDICVYCENEKNSKSFNDDLPF